MARLAGRVHGVVVQMTSDTGPVTSATPNFASSAAFVYRVERYVDRRRFVVILDFRFSQRRTAVDTPVHRLRAFVQVAVTDDFTQRTDNVGFGLKSMVRYGRDQSLAQADKVFTLAVDSAQRHIRGTWRGIQQR